MTHDIEKALVVTQAIVYAEVKDDRVQVEEALTFYNLGRTAWVPDDVVIGLPDGFTALNGQQAMGGEGIDAGREARRQDPRHVRARAAHGRVPLAAPLRRRTKDVDSTWRSRRTSRSRG